METGRMIDTLEIQEISEEELQRRIGRRNSRNADCGPVSKKTGSCSRLADLKLKKLSVSARESTAESDSSAKRPLEALQDKTTESGAESKELDHLGRYMENRMPLAADAGGDRWPGFVMDVKRTTKVGENFTSSREGYLLAELIYQAIFMWGASSSPISMLRSSVHSQLEAIEGEKEKFPLAFEDDASSSSSHRTVPMEGIEVKEDDQQCDGEIVIQEYNAETMPRRRKLKFAPVSHSDDEEEEMMAPLTRTHVASLRKTWRELENLELQIERLRILIAEDSSPLGASSGMYLSHVMLFVGASTSTSKLALCFPRSRMCDTESSEELQLLPKSRADDVWIRSVLRHTLQHDLGRLKSTSKQRCRVHLLVGYSALPGFASAIPPSIVSEQLQTVRLSQNMFGKWNPKKPLKTIRIGVADNGAQIPSPSASSVPSLLFRLGEPISLV